MSIPYFRAEPYLESFGTAVVELAEVMEWAVDGCPAPTPPLVKALTLKKYIFENACQVFIETGTGLGASVMEVAKLGIECHTIEIDTQRYNIMKEKFQLHPNVTVHHGDSAEVLPVLLKDLNQKALFWLDAHYCWDGLERAEKETPIEEELKAVLGHPVKGHVILINDIRVFGNPSGEVYRDYPTQEWVRQLFHEHHLEVTLQNDIMRAKPVKSSRPSMNLSASDAVLKVVSYYQLQPRGVVHVGANTGQEANAYAQLGVRPVVYIEPIPAVFASLQETVSNFPGHVAVRGLCSDETGAEVELNVTSNGGLSSSIFPLGRHGELYPEIEYTEKVLLRSSTLDDLLTSNGFKSDQFFYLNIDVQGAEMKVLRGATDLLLNIDVVQLEVSPTPLYEGGCTLAEVKAFLEDAGFVEELVQINPNNWGEALFVRKSSLKPASAG